MCENCKCIDLECPNCKCKLKVIPEEPQTENKTDSKKMNLNDNIDNSHNFNLND